MANMDQCALGPWRREGPPPGRGKGGPVADGTTLALGSQPQACRIVAHGRRAGRAGCATRKTTSFVWGSDRNAVILTFPYKARDYATVMTLTISAGKSAQHVLKHPRNIVVVVIVR